MFSSPAALLRNGLRLFVPVAVAVTVYLYLYPIFLTCGFPLPDNATSSDRWDAFFATAKQHWPLESRPNDANAAAVNRTARASTKIAPFRLLALGDPQLEGDTSIPNAHSTSFPHLRDLISHVSFRSEHESLRQRLRQTLHDWVDVWLEDLPNTLESYRKRADLFGNDFYLAHIVRSMRWWAKPTHVAVLGDLLGSQWVDDAEFVRRADRYWNRVVRVGERVPDDIALHPEDEYDLAGYLGGPSNNETEAWTHRIINVVGNHDIGYAGDVNDERLARFEREFGKANYELRFEIPNSALPEGTEDSLFDRLKNPNSDRLAPELRIVNLNDMVLDTPALSSAIQDSTYQFINSVINTASAVEFKGHFTIVLTHVPLYKIDGVCVDGPLFTFHEHDNTLKEQNQLSADASKGFVEGIFGMHGSPHTVGKGRGRRGVILNGHDHEGCDSWHFINQSLPTGERAWQALPWSAAQRDNLVGKEGFPGVREITVRSMMGDFGGNAGLLSAWFDDEAWEWRFEYATCALGRQHLWWAVHILDLMVVVAAVLYGVVLCLGAMGINVDRWPGRVTTSTVATQAKQEPRIKEPSSPEAKVAAVKRNGVAAR